MGSTLEIWRLGRPHPQSFWLEGSSTIDRQYSFRISMAIPLASGHIDHNVAILPQGPRRPGAETSRSRSRSRSRPRRSNVVCHRGKVHGDKKKVRQQPAPANVDEDGKGAEAKVGQKPAEDGEERNDGQDKVTQKPAPAIVHVDEQGAEEKRKGRARRRKVQEKVKEEALRGKPGYRFELGSPWFPWTTQTTWFRLTRWMTRRSRRKHLRRMGCTSMLMRMVPDPRPSAEGPTCLFVGAVKFRLQ